MVYLTHCIERNLKNNKGQKIIEGCCKWLLGGEKENKKEKCRDFCKYLMALKTLTD